MVRAASSGEFESLYSSDSREKVQETKEKMNHILDSVEVNIVKINNLNDILNYLYYIYDESFSFMTLISV